MIITKYAKQKMDILKVRQPHLYATVNSQLPHLSDEDKGKVAGLIIEAVLKSGGNATIFEDELDNSSPEISDEFLYLD